MTKTEIRAELRRSACEASTRRYAHLQTAALKGALAMVGKRAA